MISRTCLIININELTVYNRSKVIETKTVSGYPAKDVKQLYFAYGVYIAGLFSIRGRLHNRIAFTFRKKSEKKLYSENSGIELGVLEHLLKFNTTGR